MTDIASLVSILAESYAIGRQLGAGGMATVYLAHDVKHDREVAIKVLRPELSAMLGAERFLQEIRINARLEHPHILTLIDSGETDGFLWYVLPYVRGESLRHRLTREKQLPVEEVVRIATQVAGALDYAHARGVIHRDVKPENILLHEGEAMVADFGIALAVHEAGGERISQSGLSLGTPQYMSPEQAAADRAIDARSDVYSLAAVIYEMLTGEPPHTGAGSGGRPRCSGGGYDCVRSLAIPPSKWHRRLRLSRLDSSLQALGGTLDERMVMVEFPPHERGVRIRRAPGRREDGATSDVMRRCERVPPAIARHLTLTT